MAESVFFCWEAGIRVDGGEMFLQIVCGDPDCRAKGNGAAEESSVYKLDSDTLVPHHLQQNGVKSSLSPKISPESKNRTPHSTDLKTGNILSEPNRTSSWQVDL